MFGFKLIPYPNLIGRGATHAVRERLSLALHILRSCSKLDGDVIGVLEGEEELVRGKIEEIAYIQSMRIGIQNVKTKYASA